jgi:hypothetical protein
MVRSGQELAYEWHGESAAVSSQFYRILVFVKDRVLYMRSGLYPFGTV